MLFYGIYETEKGFICRLATQFKVCEAAEVSGFFIH